jgi:predicted aspartyl protease
MGGRLGTLLLAALVAPLGAEQGSPNEMPFKLHRGHLITVRGAAGPATDLRFLLDTGAGRTVIAAPLAAGLGLSGHSSSVRAFGRTILASEVVIPELRFGAIRLERQTGLATDLFAMAQSIGLDRLDAVIGMDVLGRASFAIDYARRRIVPGAARRTRHRVPLRADRLFPVVRIELGAEPVDVIVDTGASHVVLFRSAARSALAGRARTLAASLSGSVPVSGLRLPELRVGAWLAHDVPVVLAEAPASWNRAHGLLAPTALDASYVQFDFERRTLGWDP